MTSGSRTTNGPRPRFNPLLINPMDTILVDDDEVSLEQQDFVPSSVVVDSVLKFVVPILVPYDGMDSLSPTPLSMIVLEMPILLDFPVEKTQLKEQLMI
ncbi:hypothetical protein AMTR_s00081p00142770 [Amborella trichopoda]|uniref:Uncharacterized protein n=1 Tax=Amborella trichopoda TaxID=13333 RepID=W1PBV7_AMBTC|nr:hypothetical protein AMTR_s00081p00142770 [Amborella trichopoda]